MNSLSLRTKFQLIVLGGAVLPLAIVGWWLTGTAVRSGRALLHDQLDAAIAGIATDAQGQWALRAGELQLLASNTVVRAALTAPATRLALTDSQYLQELFDTFDGDIPYVSYVDANGTERWSFQQRKATAMVRDRLSRSPADSAVSERESIFQSRTFPVELPVEAEDGRVVGTVRARVRLSSVLASDSGQRTVPGARFAVLNEQGVVFTNAPDSLNLTTPAAFPSWEFVTRPIDSAPLRLILAAPAAPFVQPFERAARIGLTVLMSVALVALIISAMLTGRVTGSIERMVVAAEAVAAGNLHGKVDVAGRDELSRLAGAFNAMTESLRRTIAELSQQRALAAVGEFAASLSHDVRNSLTAMRIDLQHASRQLDDESPATPLVKRTLESVRRLDSTVTGALRVARSGQATMSRVDVAALLQRAMTSAEPSFAANSATLAPLEPSAHPVEIDGDAGALEQLFLNLLLNSAQALQAGGRAWVELNSEASNVVVRICDNGSGVEASILDDAGPVIRSTKPDGTGLGLPIARRIAAAHGGELQVHSVVGKGTCVTVTMPAHRHG